MPRYRRIAPPGSIQHVISRFARREFRLAPASARREYARRLGEIVSGIDWALLGYALMDSHTHLAFEAGACPPDRFMRRLNTGVAKWLNSQDASMGPVFAERYRTVTIARERAGILLAYLHNNPVRARIVDSPAATDRTSHQAYLGNIAAPPWLNLRRGLELSGFAVTRGARAKFHDFVVSRSGDGRDPTLSERESDVRAAASRTRLGCQAHICTPQLRHDGVLDVPLQPRPHSPIHPRWSGSLDQLLNAVSNRTGFSREILTGRCRRRDIVAARKLAIIVAVQFLGLSQTEIGAAVGLSSSATSRLLAQPVDEALVGNAAELAGTLRPLRR